MHGVRQGAPEKEMAERQMVEQGAIGTRAPAPLPGPKGRLGANP